MKKLLFLFLVLAASLQMVRAQEPVLAGVDSIQMTYIPNTFKDNWEISVAGGPSFLWCLAHTKDMNDATYDGKFYRGVGGGGEITATKWFNPYVAARLGWYSEYLKWDNKTPWNNYVHFDVLWDWTTQFGGVNSDRIYTAAPYVHMGLVANIQNNVMVAGGVGLLNRFRLSEHWMLNIDIRATATSASKYGMNRGIGVELTPLVGVSYRFNKVGWKNKVHNPSAESIKSLQASNDELRGRIASLERENQQLAKQAAKVTTQTIVKDGESTASVAPVEFAGMPDTLHMTVYYSVNSSTLSPTEKAHLMAYVALIKMNDPNYVHRILVRGTADGETGPNDFNKKLSADRANAIKQALINAGVPAELISVESCVLTGVDKRLARASEVIVYPISK